MACWLYPHLPLHKLVIQLPILLTQTSQKHVCHSNMCDFFIVILPRVFRKSFFSLVVFSQAKHKIWHFHIVQSRIFSIQTCYTYITQNKHLSHQNEYKLQVFFKCLAWSRCQLSWLPNPLSSHFLMKFVIFIFHVLTSCYRFPQTTFSVSLSYLELSYTRLISLPYLFFWYAHTL